MTLRITKIEDAGNIDRERLVMKATSDVDLGDFVVLMTKASGEEKVKSGPISRTFWFEDKDIKKGDLVVLYTKAGKRSEKANASGPTSHFYYWGFDSPSWTEKFRPVLARAPSWQVFINVGNPPL